ncbi:MAG: hypothetical protein V3U54_13230 [Thermodesulfobacteriota bacterium]
MIRCEYCNAILNEGDPDGDAPGEYWENHVLSCPKQGKIDCGKGHQVPPMVLRMDGCFACQNEMDRAEAKKYYCPECGEQGTSEFEDSDENYDEFRCKCGCQFRIWHIIEDPVSDLGKEPREAYDPEYATELARKRYEG